MRGYGAEIVFCKAAERDAVSARLQQETGAVFVHPFEHPHVRVQLLREHLRHQRAAAGAEQVDRLAAVWAGH